MNINHLFAFINHPVNKAIADIVKYAVTKHIIPAITQAPQQPTQEEVNQTASEYAVEEVDESTNKEQTND